MSVLADSIGVSVNDTPCKAEPAAPAATTLSFACGQISPFEGPVFVEVNRLTPTRRISVGNGARVSTPQPVSVPCPTGPGQLSSKTCYTTRGAMPPQGFSIPLTAARIETVAAR